MANPEHLSKIREGIQAWNKWREENPDVYPDLKDASLMMANLKGVNLNWADLRGVDLTSANLEGASLQGAASMWANLSGTNLTGADLRKATLIRSDLSNSIMYKANLRGAAFNGSDLSGAILQEADLSETNLYRTNLTNAVLKDARIVGANLQIATLVEVDLAGAMLSDCNVYGVSAWGVKLTNIKEQSNLRVTPDDESPITVDNLEVAQFINLLLNQKKLRDVLDTITSKSVLILGRFTPERKAVLDAMADELRKYNLIPIIFDFERVSSRDFTETIKVLAGMSFFVIADITNPKSAPLELQATVPDYQIPFVPILQRDEQPFSMFRDLGGKYPWVLPVLEYESMAVLMKAFKKAVIDEAFKKHKELLRLKAETMETRTAEDYLTESV
jgi:hypothetical protein